MALGTYQTTQDTTSYRTLLARKDGTKYLMQYKWRCTFRDAFHVCCLIWPWAHTKLPKINQILEHYSNIKMEGKVVSLQDYKRLMSLE